jgi:hypothetical protein
MDEELERAFAGLRKQMNDQHERLLEAMKALAKDFSNTKGFLIEDALVLGRRTTNLEDRIDKLDKPGT